MILDHVLVKNETLGKTENNDTKISRPSMYILRVNNSEKLNSVDVIRRFSQQIRGNDTVLINSNGTGNVKIYHAYTFKKCLKGSSQGVLFSFIL